MMATPAKPQPQPDAKESTRKPSVALIRKNFA